MSTRCWPWVGSRDVSPPGQVLWSNVGRNYQGYKLVAAWPRGQVSKEAFRFVLSLSRLGVSEFPCFWKSKSEIVVPLSRVPAGSHGVLRCAGSFVDLESIRMRYIEGLGTV